MKKRALVLGGFGFVGKHVCNELEATGEYIVDAASRRTGFDLQDMGMVSYWLRHLRPDVIINCAAHVGSLHYVFSRAATVFRDNVQMASNLYQGIATCCPHVIVVNPLSNCSYPSDTTCQTEEFWLNGSVHDSVMSYGNSRRVLYYMSLCFNKEHGIETKNLLVPNTFGVGDSLDPNRVHALNGMIIRMIQAKQQGQNTFEIFGSGKPVREWAYVTDVANILVRSLSTPNLLYPVNIGQKNGYQILESAEMIKEAVGFEGDLVCNTTYQDGDPMKVLNNAKFLEVFPKFEFYNHRQGIRDTVAYYLEKLTEVQRG